jgi:hypothetical protein
LAVIETKIFARLNLFKKLGMIWKDHLVIPRALNVKIREIIQYGIHEILETENPRVLCSMLFTVTFTSGVLPAERRKTTNELRKGEGCYNRGGGGWSQRERQQEKTWASSS